VLVYALTTLDLPLVGRARRHARRDGAVCDRDLLVDLGRGRCLAFWTTDGGEFTNAFTYEA